MSIKGAAEMLGLKAPDSFWTTDAATLSMMVSGCGPGKFGDYLVPDTILFLSVKPACAIHDYMYAVGETMADKEEADSVFLANMLHIIETRSANRLMKMLRSHRAMTYYSAVRDFGGESFQKATI